MFYSEDLSLALFLEFFPNIKLLGSIFLLVVLLLHLILYGFQNLCAT